MGIIQYLQQLPPQCMPFLVSNCAPAEQILPLALQGRLRASIEDVQCSKDTAAIPGVDMPVQPVMRRPPLAADQPASSMPQVSSPIVLFIQR